MTSARTAAARLPTWWTSAGVDPRREAQTAARHAGTTVGVSRSTDGGRTWAATALEAVGVTVAVYPKDPSLVAVVDDKTRFFRSTDGGTSWPGP